MKVIEAIRSGPIDEAIEVLSALVGRDGVEEAFCNHICPLRKNEHLCNENPKCPPFDYQVKSLLNTEMEDFNGFYEGD